MLTISGAVDVIDDDDKGHRLGMDTIAHSKGYPSAGINQAILEVAVTTLTKVVPFSSSQLLPFKGSAGFQV